MCIANVAVEKFISCVDCLMSFAVASLNKTFFTKGALKWLFSRVKQVVGPQRAGIFDGFVTEMTSENRTHF
jgi:hypothetical protein